MKRRNTDHTPYWAGRDVEIDAFPDGPDERGNLYGVFAKVSSESRMIGGRVLIGALPEWNDEDENDPAGALASWLSNDETGAALAVVQNVIDLYFDR